MQKFLTDEKILEIEKKFWSPVFVYSEKKLREAVENFKNFPSEFWHTVRYAMKANSNKTILKYFLENDLKIDASSEYEVYRAMNAGFEWKNIQISSQELSKNFEKLLETWVFFVATSLHQLEEFWKIKQWWEVWIRINPWVWSWAFKAIATWWTTSAFWIWHEYIPQIQEISKKYDLRITKIHLHIWSENTPESWVDTANIWLDFIKIFEDVETLDMWWGFKMAIMDYEKSADLQSIWKAVWEKIKNFYKETWRKIHLELEPWKYMVINSANLICQVNDIVDTWKDWYTFIRTNTWMTEMPRTPMYWIQQEISVISKNLNNSETEGKNFKDYVVVWHCCESWDILTCKLYDQEVIETIKLPEVSIWDLMVVASVWAYNSSMSMKNYNSFPEVWEVFLKEDWEIIEVRKRENLEEIWRNEV